MLYPQYRMARMLELATEQWGEARIPDLLEVYNIARPKSVLEIGCFRGVSTEFWLLHCARVHAVDPWEDLVVRGEFLLRCGHYPHLDYIQGRSPAALPEVKVDLAYIDGDHSYDAVRADISACLERVHMGGWIGGHDYKWGVLDGAVIEAVKSTFGCEPRHVTSDGSWLVRV